MHARARAHTRTEGLAYLLHIVGKEHVFQIRRDGIFGHIKIHLQINRRRVLAGRQRFDLSSSWTRTYKRGVGQEDLRLIGEDVELDDVAVAVPVDDLRVCIRMKQQKQT